MCPNPLGVAWHIQSLDPNSPRLTQHWGQTSATARNSNRGRGFHWGSSMMAAFYHIHSLGLSWLPPAAPLLPNTLGLEELVSQAARLA
ncbi:hypothetical protein PAL_GLEAN10012032 [Pteropus alecto]|uniref:Uncharacterized protein n=1 Tax=Pteropus alecto TaxID=9402 RepID=L5K809_PTEAL|nr:hypothetical protein PAL_GLEAN10012032 [Pteropus alecto]